MTVNWTRQAVKYAATYPEIMSPAPVEAEIVTFPHLRRQSDRTITDHAILAEQHGDHAYAKACTDEMARRTKHRRLA